MLVVGFDAALTGYEFLVVFVVADEVGEVGVGEAEEDHVAVVVGLWGVALPVEDAIEHIESLDDLVVGGVFVGEAEVAFEGSRGVADAVVEDVASAEEGGGGDGVERVELVLRSWEVFEIEGDVVWVVGVAELIV